MRRGPSLQPISPSANFVPLSADFTKAASANDGIESVASRFGGLDVLVHVMGGFAGGKTIAETDDATWEQMRDLNLSSAFYAFRAAIPYLRKSGSGRIVAIGSLTAVEPHAGLGAYVTFKSALTTLVRTVALENKDAGLTANVILPGTMDTPDKSKVHAGRGFFQMGATEGCGRSSVVAFRRADPPYDGCRRTDRGRKCLNKLPFCSSMRCRCM